MKACTRYDPVYMRFKNRQNASMLLGRQAEVLSGHGEERGWKGDGAGGFSGDGLVLVLAGTQVVQLLRLLSWTFRGSALLPRMHAPPTKLT